MITIIFLLQTIRIAIPYLLAAAGGVISERVGVIALGLEGMMLAGAFGAMLGSWYSGSAWVGILTALIAGISVALLMALCTLRFRADQVVTGIAINLLVVGCTRFFLRLSFDSASNSPRVAGFGGESSSMGLLSSFSNPLVWIGIAALPTLAWVLWNTSFGLRIRATGEKPEAASTAGVNVRFLQLRGLMICGALAALGGAYLALDQHQFTDSMTAGRGFIALAAIIFGRWMPWRIGIACLLFAAAETLQIHLQGSQFMPSQFVVMIPYVLTIVAVAGIVGRSRPPAALGKTA